MQTQHFFPVRPDYTLRRVSGRPRNQGCVFTRDRPVLGAHLWFHPGLLTAPSLVHVGRL